MEFPRQTVTERQSPGSSPVGSVLRRFGRLFARVRFVAPCVVIVGAIAYVNYTLPTSWIILSSLAIIAIAMIRPSPAIVTEVPTGIAVAPPAEVTVQPAMPAMRNLVACLPDPCFLLQPDGAVIYQNSPAEQAVGALQKGSSIYALLREPDVQTAVERTAETGEPTQVQYFERVPSERLFDIHLAIPTDSGANARRPIIMILRDLTQQHRLDRMRTDFVANASHELRTPLASLIGFIDTLKGPAREDAKARDKFLDIMGVQAGRMSRLIDDLLSLSRIEMNLHIRPRDSVNLSDVAAHVVDTLKPIASKAKVELCLDGTENNHFVLGFRDELVQVVQNLVENAIKYGPDGGKVEIDLRQVASPRKPDRVQLQVRDFGPGIEPEHLPRLTERFYRVDAVSSREKGGTGLGLAIVKHILNRHKGILKIESTPGQGAVFSVILDGLPAEPAVLGNSV